MARSPAPPRPEGQEESAGSPPPPPAATPAPPRSPAARSPGRVPAPPPRSPAARSPARAPAPPRSPAAASPGRARAPPPRPDAGGRQAVSAGWPGGVPPGRAGARPAAARRPSTCPGGGALAGRPSTCPGVERATSLPALPSRPALSQGRADGRVDVWDEQGGLLEAASPSQHSSASSRFPRLRVPDAVGSRADSRTGSRISSINGLSSAAQQHNIKTQMASEQIESYDTDGGRAVSKAMSFVRTRTLNGTAARNITASHDIQFRETASAVDELIKQINRGSSGADEQPAVERRSLERCEKRRSAEREQPAAERGGGTEEQLQHGHQLPQVRCRARRRERKVNARDPRRKVALQIAQRHEDEDELGRERCSLFDTSGIPMRAVNVLGCYGTETVDLVDVNKLRSQCLPETRNVRSLLEHQRQRDRLRAAASWRGGLATSGSAPSLARTMPQGLQWLG